MKCLCTTLPNGDFYQCMKCAEDAKKTPLELELERHKDAMYDAAARILSLNSYAAVMCLQVVLIPSLSITTKIIFAIGGILNLALHFKYRVLNQKP
jgi:hypothetical protein